MDEKRKFPRLDISVVVKWKKVPTAPPPSDHEGTTKNLSGAGICIVLYEKLEIGNLLDLAVELPNKITVVAQGRVVWVREAESLDRKGQKRYENGIEFLNISDVDRQEIRRFEVHPYIYTQ